MLRRGIFLFLMVFISFAVASEGDEASSPKVSDVAQEQEAYYAPDEVSTAGVDLQKELSDINVSLTPSEEIANMQTSLPTYVGQLHTMRADIVQNNLESHSIKSLKKLIEQTKFSNEKLHKFILLLQERIDIHTEALEKLKTLESRWIETLQFAVHENAPDAITARIKQHLSDIALMHNDVKRSYDNVLVYTDMAISEEQELNALLKLLEKTKSTQEARLFVKDSDSLITTLQDYHLDLSAFLNATLKTTQEIYHNVIIFYETNSDSLYIHVFMTLLVLALMMYLYIREKKGHLVAFKDDKIRASTLFVRSPIASTIILSVLMVAAIYPERPIAVAYVNVLIALAALLVIIYKITNHTLFQYALLLSGLFAMGQLINQIISFEDDIRLLWLSITVIMLLAFSRILRPKGLFAQYVQSSWIRFLNKAGYFVVVVLTIALIANFTGFYRLAHKLAYSALISLTIFMAFLVIAMVINGLVVIFVRRRSYYSKHLLETYATQIEGNLKFIVNTFLIFYWGYLVLKELELTSFIARYYDVAMTQSWEIGNATLSLGSLVDFFIVLAITSFMARFVKIFLDLEVFSRYELPRGMPTAIQVMIRYFIIAVGVIFSLSVLGITMSDLSLLAGALGVGIGFGLRNIMANFVSGILMIFERPIQLGDVVEVDKIFGDVQRIGIRATTIKTYDGSEVLIPNADFITKDVTNWTLSSKLRRVKMAYKVAFGNNPRDVIEVIRSVIDAHVDIKDDPQAKVLFEGYGDYYLEFTVYFWVDDRLLDIKSETAIAIYEALSQAGIEMPIPLSNVRYEVPLNK